MAEHTRLASLLVMITAAGFLLGALLFTLANTSSSGVRSPGVTVTGRPTSTVTDPSTAATALPAAEPSPEAPAAQAVNQDRKSVV